MSNEREVWEKLQRAKATLTPEGRAVWDACVGCHTADSDAFNAAGKAALRAALPAEPPEWFLTLYSRYTSYHGAPRMWADIRTQILGDDA